MLFHRHNWNYLLPNLRVCLNKGKLCDIQIINNRNGVYEKRRFGYVKIKVGEWVHCFTMDILLNKEFDDKLKTYFHNNKIPYFGE